MSDQPSDEHLSRISTMWTMMYRAHRGSDESILSAQDVLLKRYCGAIYRYLHAVLRSSDAADELAQEFALGFLNGKFKGASPEKGRFRDYLKRSLFNLIRDYKNRQRKQEPGVDLDDVQPVALPSESESEQMFLQGWRDELLARTWEALAAYEKESGRIYHSILQYRTQHPEASSNDAAKVFSQRFGKTFTAANIRQLTHRAREKFGDLLMEETARTVQSTNTEDVQQELVDLGLLSYCEDAVKRWAERVID